MQKERKQVKSMSEHGFSQFELSKNVLNNLYKFKLTPTSKLVLLYLVDCYNENHQEVFPKQRTIADKLGVTERSVIRAIQELNKEGLILITNKLSNIYRFTSKIVCKPPQNKNTNCLIESDKISSINDNLSSTCIEQIKELKKQQTVVVLKNFPKEDAEGVSSTAIPSDIPDCLKCKAEKGEITNLTKYWNSLRPHVKERYKKQDILEKQKAKDAENAEKYAMKQIEETRARIEEQKRWIGDDPKKCQAIKDVLFRNWGIQK